MMNISNYIESEIEKTCLVDFDGTIIPEIKISDINFLDKEPLDGVKSGLYSLKSNGFRIKIWSCRTSAMYPVEFRKNQYKMIKSYMKKWELDFDEILFTDKPFARCYIDSRSIKPDWNNILELVKNAK